MTPEDKARFITIGIAAVVIFGGMVQIFVLLWLHIISGDAGLAILGPLIGGALTWLFQKDTTRDAAKANKEAAEQGAALAVTPYPSPTEETKA